MVSNLVGEQMNPAFGNTRQIGPPANEEEFTQRKTALTEFFARPETNAALIQFAISVLGPTAPGQTTGSKIATSVGEGLQAAGRVSSQRREQELEERKLSQGGRRLDIEDRRADIEEKKAAVAERLQSARIELDTADLDLKRKGLSLKERIAAHEEALKKKGFSLEERKLILKGKEIELKEAGSKRNAPVEEIVGPDGKIIRVPRQESINKEVPPKQPTALQNRISTLEQFFLGQGKSTIEAHDLATKIATNVLGVGINPANGEPFLFDKATRERFELTESLPATSKPEKDILEAGSGPTTGTSPSVKIPTGASQATGIRGFITEHLNTALDAMNFGLVSSENEEARIAFKNLKNQTMISLLADIPGRPTDFLRESVENLVPEPNSLLKGSSRSLIQLKTMRQRISDEISRIQTDIIAKPREFRQTVMQAAKSNLSQLKSLLTVYDRMIAGFGLSSETIATMDCQALRRLDPLSLGLESRRSARNRWNSLSCGVK